MIRYNKFRKLGNSRFQEKRGQSCSRLVKSSYHTKLTKEAAVIGRVLGVVEDSWRATPEEQAVLDEIHSGKKRK